MDKGAPQAPPAKAQEATPPRPSVNGDQAELNLRVPADAKVVINGYTTKSEGSSRKYVSHGLEPGKSYRYEIRVEVQRDGETLTRTKVAQLRARQNTDLVFDFDFDPDAPQLARRSAR